MAATNDWAERRASPRFDIAAQARVVFRGETSLLKLRNVSASGAFLEGRARDHADLVPGVEIDLVISVTLPGAGGDEVVDIDEAIEIECRGRVARRELRTPSSAGGFGISMEPKTIEDRERLEDLLGRLIALPAAQRPASLAESERPHQRMPPELSLPLKVPPVGVMPVPPVGTKPVPGLEVVPVSVPLLELPLPVEPVSPVLLPLLLVAESLELDVSPNPVDDGSVAVGDVPESGE